MDADNPDLRRAIERVRSLSRCCAVKLSTFFTRPCLQGAGEPLAHLSGRPCGGFDRPPVRGRPSLRPAHQHLDHGILALVGGPPVGRGVRSVRNRHCLSPSRPHGPGAGFGRDDVCPGRNHYLPRRRRPRHVPPSLFQRNAGRCDRARQRVLGARSGAADGRRLRGLQPRQTRGAVRLAEGLPLAVHVFLFRAGLESDRRRPLRIPDQSAARALLYAGAQHDGDTRPCPCSASTGCSG